MPRFGEDQNTLLGEAADEQLVVAAEHASSLAGLVDPSAEGGLTVGEPDPLLDLALVDVPAIHEIARAIEVKSARIAATEDRPDRVAQMRAERVAEGLPAPSAMEIFLDDIRRTAAARFGGWVPLMGQNRLMRNVAGLPHVSPGGEGFPKAVAPPPETATAVAGDLLTGPVVGLLDGKLVESSALAGRYLIDPTSVWHRSPDEVPGQWLGHALFNAGIIAREAPAARLMISSVLDDRSVASCWDVARELVRLARARVDVLCCPLGCFTFDGQPPLLLARAAARLGDTLLVASAGNHWTDDPEQLAKLPKNAVTYPAAIDTVVAVAAEGKDRKGIAPFSPRGLPWIDVVAPGEDIESNYFDGPVRIRDEDGKEQTVEFRGWASWEGTSMSAAFVSGWVANRMVTRGCTAHQAFGEYKNSDQHRFRQVA